MLASDYGETLVNAIMAGVGGSLLAAWLQQVASHSVDANTSAAWGAGASGIVLLSPVVGDMLADVLTDIRIGWERGKPPEPELPEPEPEQIKTQEIDAGQRDGEWWYRTDQGRLCCYHTPTRNGKPIVSYIRMRAICSAVNAGIPFSLREMIKRVQGLTDPQFRLLQKDFRQRSLYIVNGNRAGQFTMTGKQVVSAIANYPPAPTMRPPAPLPRTG